MSNLRERRLQWSRDNQRLISVYDDEDEPENFHVGVAASWDEDFLTLDAVDKSGRAEGRTMLRESLIILLEFESNYLSVLRELYEPIESAKLPSIPGPSLSDLLGFLVQERMLATVSLGSDIEMKGILTAHEPEEHIEYDEYEANGAHKTTGMVAVRRILSVNYANPLESHMAGNLAPPGHSPLA